MVGTGVCVVCGAVIIWVSTPRGPALWCAGCRRDLAPETMRLVDFAAIQRQVRMLAETARVEREAYAQ